MAAFYPDLNEETHLLLIKRQGGNGVHAHQIALPGGKYESFDFDLKETALREAYEEVGILKTQIRSVRALSSLYIPPSNFIVQPFMALYDKAITFCIRNLRGAFCYRSTCVCIAKRRHCYKPVGTVVPIC